MPEPSRASGAPPSRRPLGMDRVPVLPPGAPFLLEALHDDDLSFTAIARAIERVPSVAARLLALANSAWSSPASPVTSIEVACARLGLRVVRTASIALAVSQPFNPARCPAFIAATFWTTALLNAEAASWLAQQFLPPAQSTVRTAGLLANLGLVWLAEALPAETALALDTADRIAPGSTDRCLAERCGLGYVEAGTLLAEAWRLPENLRDAIARQLHSDAQLTPLCQLVSAAIHIVWILRHRLPWETADERLIRLGLDAALQEAARQHMVAMHTRTTALAETLFGRGAGCSR